MHDPRGIAVTLPKKSDLITLFGAVMAISLPGTKGKVIYR